MATACLTFAILWLSAVKAWSAPEVVLVIGEPGEPEFATRFQQAHEDWTNLFAAGEIEATIIGVDSNETSDLDLLKQAVTNAPDWIVLYGHGSFDGRDGRFNLRGPDITAKELAKLLPKDEAVAVVAAFASSVAFLPELSHSNRVVMTSTRDLGEDSFSYFGSFLPKALADEEADIDQDGAVSLLEGWLLASKLTGEFYVNEQRILTEHALIDDNGDKKGTPTEAFSGLRAQPLKDGATADGNRARQLTIVPSAEELAMSEEDRATRDTLERELLALRDRKTSFADEDEYYVELEKVLRKLGAFYKEK